MMNCVTLQLECMSHKMVIDKMKYHNNQAKKKRKKKNEANLI